MNKLYTPCIGLEVHVELMTKSKMFCPCSGDHFGKEPNSQTCPVCLGLPGALPVPNKKAITWCITLGLALHCSIPEESKFDRKNYFYPDLPKGYQISQYDKPFCINGWLEIDNRKIRIRRVHMEEDTGKLQHVTVGEEHMTLVDFNRSGVPLVEIVTEPDFHTIAEVDRFVKKLQRIIRYLEISNADMEKGSMRIEPSISLRSSSSEGLPGYRVELKNINSFKFVRKAIEYEITRQSEILNRGEDPVQQTRGWNESKNVTLPQREKEEAHDYRYFPEPDIPPFRFLENQLSIIKNQIGELPDAKLARFQTEYQLSVSDSELLTETKGRADYFEACIELSKTQKGFADLTPKQIANTLINRYPDVKNYTPHDLLLSLVSQRKDNEVDIRIIIKTIETIIAANSNAVEDYKKGKDSVLMFLIGQVKKALKGKGDPTIIENHLKKEIHAK